MTGKYHQTRTSDGFYHLWSELTLAATGSAPEPTFFQDATDRVFREMVIAAFPIEKATAAASGPEPGGITYEDANVVRYIAGYVCKKVRRSIETSLRPNKAELLKCVEGLLSDEDNESPSADWVDVVDRGGLLRVKEGTYMLFCAMEEEVREHFKLAKADQLAEGNREHVEESVLENDEVLFQWCMLTADVDDTESAVVLGMLVKLWITVRGFSFTSAWLELYKQRKKAGLEKSKALRKEL